MLDVVVCGAGPAGSLTALMLARAGVKVLILDRATFPRAKLCGDTVNPGALAILRRHALDEATRGASAVEGMIVSGPGGARVEARYGEGIAGRAILRRDLDARLVEAAVAAGAQLDEGVRVDGPVINDGTVTGVRAQTAAGKLDSIAARVVIAADGAHSRIASSLGLARAPVRPRRWAVGAYFEDVAGLTTCGEMHVRTDRYIGIAPLPRGLVNVCVVTENRALLADAATLIPRSVKEDDALAARFRSARMTSSPVSFGPLAVECAVPGMPGLLLVGDAAGFIDPMTGDGLRFALRGAELTATEALRALAQGFGDAHARLGAARCTEFRGKWRFNRALRALVGSRAALGLADRGASAAPFILRSAISYAGDVADLGNAGPDGPAYSC